ncbi:5168_t:CDS:2, partial [Acaulospora colombiana]
SKVLAEQSAWEFVKEKKPSFDLPIISETTINIGGSNAFLLNEIKKDRLEKLTREFALTEFRMIDVRDLAGQHVQALLIPAAGGERFLTSSYEMTWQRPLNSLFLVDIINQSAIPGIEPIKGYPEALKDWQPSTIVPREKVKGILGTRYRPAEETIKDTVGDAVSIGWAQ